VDHTWKRPRGFAVVMSVSSSHSPDHGVQLRTDVDGGRGDVLARAALLVLSVTLAAAVAWVTIIAVIVAAWRALT